MTEPTTDAVELPDAYLEGFYSLDNLANLPVRQAKRIVAEASEQLKAKTQAVEFITQEIQSGLTLEVMQRKVHRRTKLLEAMDVMREKLYGVVTQDIPPENDEVETYKPRKGGSTDAFTRQCVRAMNALEAADRVESNLCAIPGQAGVAKTIVQGDNVKNKAVLNGPSVGDDVARFAAAKQADAPIA